MDIKYFRIEKGEFIRWCALCDGMGFSFDIPIYKAQPYDIEVDVYQHPIQALPFGEKYFEPIYGIFGFVVGYKKSRASKRFDDWVNETAVTWPEIKNKLDTAINEYFKENKQCYSRQQH